MAMLWKSRKTESMTPIPSPEPSRPAFSALTTVPAPSLAAPSKAVHESTICQGQSFKGFFSGDGSIFVDGGFAGNIDMPNGCVTVGAHGHVSDGLSVCINAREIVVIGSIAGNIAAADRVDIRATGRLVGNVSAGRICIADGAFFKGDIDLRRIDPKPVSSAVVRISEAARA